MKSRQLLNLWTEWLSTSETLLRALHEQTVAVTLRDVPRVEKLQPELDELMESIRTVDTLALAEAKRLAEELGAPLQSLRGLVSVLDKTEAAQVQLTANKVLSASQNIQDVVHKNRKLFESEMTYINGTLTLIAKAAVIGKGPYRGRKSGSTSVLVDAAA
ncbi:MAG: flagellar export chaperone FlgN [Armatimonadetes bacterium]|nr:hypothetical protein [Armatimonadota bacterium]MBS1704200.1 flagellar export chaperone FlgN [Armatimonadota bacterium]MBS1726997.1 flagellar export chaperone FlgN [Armatimonadota bacterium]